MLFGKSIRSLSERAGLSCAVVVIASCACFGQQPTGPGLPQFPQPAAPNRPSGPASELVAGVRIIGNETVTEDEIISYVRTRQDRQFDKEMLQQDKAKLKSSGLFRDVTIYTQNTPRGIVVTFEVFERPTIRDIAFHGNRGLNDKVLLKQCGLEVGDALNFYAVEEARRKVEDYYHSKGYPKAEAGILEGNKPEHRAAVFSIAEGPLQRISKVEFVGNRFVSGQRLKTRIKSKPGILWLFGGKVERNKIAADIDRLTQYYRSYGFFKARVGRELDFDDDNKWLTLRFVVDEGPQFVIRNVSVVGNSVFNTASIHQKLELEPGEFFNQGEMARDVNALRDVYGGQGYIFADVKPEPRFSFEVPGQMDVVYNITEGNQFRVGRINVHIAGEFPHTRESVVFDRLSIRPGDIVDIREVRASERRLKSSQLFENDPATGKSPRVVIRPPELEDTGNIARQGAPTIRGQSPDRRSLRRQPRRIDLDIYVIPSTSR
jgi:outer membrane protein insertion porin family